MDLRRIFEAIRINDLEIPKCGPEGLDAYLQSKAVIAMVS